MITYDSFKSKRLGKWCIYPPVKTAECVSLAKAYVEECILGSTCPSLGHAKDFITNLVKRYPDKLKLVDKKEIKKGDILTSKSTATNPYGHIGMVDSVSWTTVMIFDQNSGAKGNMMKGDEPRVHSYKLSYRDKACRPIVKWKDWSKQEKLINEILALNSSQWQTEVDYRNELHWMSNDLRAILAKYC